MSETAKHKHGKPAKNASPEGKDIDLPRPDMAFDPIAAALRQLHEQIASEQIPDDFLDLLDQLDDRSGPE